MPSKVSSRKRKAAPEWATAPFEHFIAEAERLTHVARLSSIGISMIQARPKIIEVLMKIREDDSIDESQRLKTAREDADLSKREVESGFPILHAWAVVGLWALLEATNRKFLTEWLTHKRTAWRIEPIQRLKIRLGEYESMPKNHRYSFVVALLERDLAASLKGGVSRFEAMLQPFGLSGEIPGRLEREMFEFSQVRNLIAHNAGKVDQRFVKACPWLKVRVGDDFLVSGKMLAKYCAASIYYITLVICRVGESFAIDMSKERLSIMQSFEK